MARPAGARVRATIFLVISLFSAAIASLVIYTVLQNFEEQLVEASIPEQKVEVVTAVQDLPPGKTISLEDLTIVALPPAYVPAAIYTNPEEVIGRVPQERILRHEFIREERLAVPEAGLGLNAIVPRGMRALSVNISSASAVSGFLNPGNYVDVLVSLSGEDGERETITLLQAVELLAVNDRAGGTRATTRSSPSVTLAVSLEDAERMAHATASGAVVLTLRNDIDVTKIESHGDLAELLIGESDTERVPVTQWRQRTEDRGDGTLIIIRGSATSKERSN